MEGAESAWLAGGGSGPEVGGAVMGGFGTLGRRLVLAQGGLAGVGRPGRGGEESAGLQRERLRGTMKPGASQAASGVVAPTWVALMLEGCCHCRVLGWTTEWVSPGKGLP